MGRTLPVMKWMGATVLLAAAGAAGGAVATTASPAGGAGGDALPSQVRLTGVVRDFRRYDVSGGHPDFQQYNSGHTVGMVQESLDADGKPVFAGQGRSVSAQFKDRLGRNINPALYDRARGDTAGTLASVVPRGVSSAASFGQWFRDVPGLNMSKAHAITLTRREGSSIYTFHEQDVDSTEAREGFFPCDGELFNDTDPTYGHNYHFTFELDTTFRYERGSGQVFTFVGDDDVWVYIDGKLAIDVGGVHGAVQQTIDLDRFADKHGLASGERYQLKFFFAERRTTRSNCRIETTLKLDPAELPVTSALYD